ncbi:MAG: polysaccharide biosynthesis/export family protein [Phycisphaerales bacterium]|nr:MAG: polysaccharide biosynthesis/export family protein [Phycisphaerales bacterium]
MSGISWLVRSQPGHGVSAVRLMAGLVMGLAAVVGGCADHRVSLAEFLALQQEASAPEPAVEPATEAEMVALLERALGRHKVGPSDVLEVTLTVSADAGLMPPVQARVDRNGEISLPVVGAVKVADMELEDVEDAVHQAYVPRVFKEASVFVNLVSADTTEVLVVGAVTEPGLVPLHRNQRNMLFAIVLAGGVSELASGDATLRRTRHPGEAVSFDLMDPEGIRSALALEPLEDGDVITVEAATPNTVFVGGLVNAARPQIYPQGVEMTVLQAIAAAGGLRTDVTPREATLIRRMSDGQDVHVKLDLDRMTTGKDPNLALAAGDILWVPDTVETRVQDWINRNIFVRAGVSVNYSVSGIEFMNRQDQQAGYRAGGLEDQYDPYGFLGRGTSLQSLVARPAPVP